jgi:two-component system NtrC family sensor kinase
MRGADAGTEAHLTQAARGAGDRPSSGANGGDRFRGLLWRTLSRQVMLYFLPLLLLAVFFNLQHRRILVESERTRMEVIAEHQAHTLDLFLRERLVNLANVVDDPAFRASLAAETSLPGALVKLRQASSAFVDIGVVDGEGRLVHYHGPVDFPGPVSYDHEAWYLQLMNPDRQSVITDIYSGVRRKPHFTIAVKRITENGIVILRSALSPERISEYLTTLEGASEVNASVVNAAGVFQVVTPRVGAALQQSPYLPPRTPARGHLPSASSRGSGDFAYSWLSEVPWALVVEGTSRDGSLRELPWMPSNVQVITVLLFVVVGVVIVVRARQLVQRQIAVERHEAELTSQLVQAAKLASLGELAAGIAHEINNPLAIIAEEIGVLKDSLDPELTEEGEETDLEQHLDIMYEAVFRCRDITRKLLSFVRKSEVSIAAHALHEVLDEVVDGILDNELTFANVKVVREYDSSLEPILTDRNQLIQVVLNLVKNAVDAMPDGGTLTLATTRRGDRAVLAVKDTGCGMTAEQLKRVFTPFFTTKAAGKGTGLGLSVSMSIVKSFDGDLFVNSVPDRGSIFTVELPFRPAGRESGEARIDPDRAQDKG